MESGDARNDSGHRTTEVPIRCQRFIHLVLGGLTVIVYNDSDLETVFNVDSLHLTNT